jgi:hypothetical protein
MVNLEDEYSTKAAEARAARVREMRKREQQARARSTEPIEQPDELAAKAEQLAAVLGGKVKRKAK